LSGQKSALLFITAAPAHDPEFRVQNAVELRAQARPPGTEFLDAAISLAFLAPDLVRAAVEGRLPRGLGVERLRNAPAEWRQQFEALGLKPG